MTRNQQWRGALLCVAIYLGCLLIAWPVAEMGFVDDWSYIKTAQVFADTGHLVYNGWAAPMQGWQSIWGATVVHFFGFSWMAVKLSMIPVGLATVILFYLLLLKSNINLRNAVISTLTLALSPIFLPLSVSFMTDLPGLLPIVACLLMCKLAIDAESNRAAILWLVAAAFCNLAGGTARQVAWLGVLVIVPSAGWLLRRRRKPCIVAAALWITFSATVCLCMRWISSQPYSISNDLPPLPPLGSMSIALLSIFIMLGVLSSLVLLSMPVLVPWVFRLRSVRYKKVFVLILLLLVALQVLYGKPFPWISHMYFSEFSSQRIAANRTDMGHSLLSLPGALLLLFFVAISALSFVDFTLEKVRCGWRKCWSEETRQMLCLCIPYMLSYFALLAPRAIHRAVVDRYMLGLAPVAILCLVKLYQEWVAPELPKASIVLLAVMAILSVAGTHDWFAWQRARLAAIAELTSAGIPRTSFYGGIEYDGWTQIEHGGYINNPFITNPPDAYKPQPPVSKDDQCGYDFAPYVPAIHAEYTIVFEPKPCFEPAPFAPVTYTSWIPPFRRTIYVQRIPESRRR